MRTRTLSQLASLAGILLVSGGWSTGGDPGSLPEELRLVGVVRDFRERSEPGGHIDFERRPRSGFGLYMGMVQDELGQDRNPMFKSTGRKVGRQWKDRSGRPIIFPRPYIQQRPGDQQGRLGAGEGAMDSAEYFRQWFKDVPGVNASRSLALTFHLQQNTDVYVFDNRLDEQYRQLGGFFPINGELYGNSAGENKNYHFTFELNTVFQYHLGSGQMFKFTGDDDVWVFIDGKLVIDLGGVHEATSQTIDLDRLEWLEDGEIYTLDFFFAERHRTQSNFRIETTLQLTKVDLPTTTALYD